MFAVARRRKGSGGERRAADRLTQIGRALQEFGIGWIGALSPQAKGRVERGFGTDQDRLVELLRLARVRSRTEANLFLAGVLDGNEKARWQAGIDRRFQLPTGLPPIAPAPALSFRAWASAPGAPPARLIVHTPGG